MSLTWYLNLLLFLDLKSNARASCAFLCVWRLQSGHTVHAGGDLQVEPVTRRTMLTCWCEDFDPTRFSQFYNYPLHMFDATAGTLR